MQMYPALLSAVLVHCTDMYLLARRKKKSVSPVAIALPIVAVTLVPVCLYLMWRRRRHRKGEDTDDYEKGIGSPQKVSSIVQQDAAAWYAPDARSRMDSGQAVNHPLLVGDRVSTVTTVVS